MVRFTDEEKIPEILDKLNAYLGYGEEEAETLMRRSIICLQKLSRMEEP